MSEMDHAAMGHAMPQAPEPAPAQQPMSEMDHAAMGHGAPPEATDQQSGGMDHAAMGHTMPQGEEPAPAQQPMSGMDHAAMGHAMPPASADADPFYAPGSGLMPKAANGGKFLSRSEEHTSEIQSLMRISYA